MKEKINRILEYLNQLLLACFNPENEIENKWLPVLWIGALIVVGILLWGTFLNWGDIPFDFHDWAEITAARLAFLQDSVIKGVLPLHMPDSTALRGVTDRFLSIPDMLLSPQIQLLRFMEIGVFVLLNVLFLYGIGTWGLIQLRKKFSLSLAAFTILFFLFHFNGHILSHHSIGHITWGGYFLYPWLALLVFRLLDGERSWQWIALTSFLLFIIFLQGSYHHFVWALFFLGFLGLSRWELFPILFKTLILSISLSMVRILTPALELGKFDTEFKGGYPTLLSLLRSMTTIVPPQDALAGRSPLTELGWWEFDLYIGVAGTALLLYFGVYYWVKNQSSSQYSALLLPIGAITLLSIGNIYRVISILQIPLIAGERVSSRMIILPFVFLSILAAKEFQNWFRDQQKYSLTVRLTGIGVLVLLAHDLWQYIRLWQVNYVHYYFPLTEVDLSIKLVANHLDPPYINALIAGAIITGLSAVFLIYQVLQEQRKSLDSPSDFGQS